MRFPAYPKTPRFNMGCLVTEKIDGTNACIVVEHVIDGKPGGLPSGCATEVTVNGINYAIAAGSRKRWITPEKDNFGFARFVHENAERLVELLGEGLHYGEWWGSGIQRGYAQNGKRLSLFDGPGRYPWALDEEWEYAQAHLQTRMVAVGDAFIGVVPLLYQGSLDEILTRLGDTDELRRFLGIETSHAQIGWTRPEGVIVQLRGSGGGQRFKIVWDKS
jgi:hypothetical protein